MSHDPDVAPLIDLISKTKIGTSATTTFGWFSDLIHGVCWLMALPVELVLNRRMGRRYTGFLPLLFVYMLLSLLLGFWISAHTNRLPGASFDPRIPLVGWAVQLGFLLVVLRHRLADWWRFRTEDQVHSFSCGVPFWLNPPRWLVKFLGVKPPADPPVALAWDSTIPADAKGLALALAVVVAAIGYVGREWRPFVREWLSGEVPTGPIAWIMATVVHPLLLNLIGGMLIFQAPLVAFLFLVAGLAIFVKARIEKAHAVEKVYDLFDARIEQQFTAALADPVSLRKVERTGFVVPGIARNAATASARSGPRTLTPEIEALMNGDRRTVVVRDVANMGVSATPSEASSPNP